LGFLSVSNKLNDLLQAHMAVIALLESSFLSTSTRGQLEVFRESLEADIAALRVREHDDEGDQTLKTAAS